MVTKTIRFTNDQLRKFLTHELRRRNVSKCIHVYHVIYCYIVELLLFLLELKEIICHLALQKKETQ